VIVSVSSWVFYTAQTWSFLASSGTAAAVAYLPIVLVIPVPIALVIGGILTDRRGPKATLVFAQGANATTMAAIALLDATHQLTFLATLGTGFLLGIFAGLGNVPGQALLVRIVDRRMVAKAFALSLVTTGIGRLLGGPIGGTVVATYGAVPAFVLAALGMIVATLIFLSLPRAEPLETAGPKISRQDLVDAYGWVRRTPTALAVIAVNATMAAVIYPYTAIVPVIARDLLAGGAGELGLLISAGGVGAIVSGFLLAPLGRRLGQGALFLAGVTVAGAGIVALGLSGSVLVSSVVAAVIGGASIGASVTSGMLLQTMSPPRTRGRVLALDSVLWNLVNPVSLLVIGLAVAQVGAGPVLVGMGLLAAVAVGAIGLGHRPVVHLDVDPEGEVTARQRAGVPAVPSEVPGAG
jgi:MFS family permease